MTNCEIVIAELNLFEIADINARRRTCFITSDYLFAEDGTIDDISEDSDDLDDDRDLNPIDPSRLELNPHDQPLHPEEDALRGKFAIDMPAFTAHDLYMIRVCSKVRQYLIDGDIASENANHKFRKAVTKMARFCFLHEGKLYKKRRGIIREVCDSYKLGRETLFSSYDGTAHCGIENTHPKSGVTFLVPIDGEICLSLYRAVPSLSTFCEIRINLTIPELY
jgi:hypothetical protein